MTLKNTASASKSAFRFKRMPLIVQQKRVRPLLGTYVEISLEGKADTTLLQACITAGFEAMSAIDRLMSLHKPKSDISRLNWAVPGTWVRLSPQTTTVLRAAQELYQSSRGIFDIRCGSVLMKRKIYKNVNVGPLLEAAGDDVMKKTSSSPAGVSHTSNALMEYGPTLPLEIRRTSARKMGPWILDLGGLAKGYAVDCAVAAIQRKTRGLHLNGTVNAGGDLRTWGKGYRSVQVSNPTKTWARSFPAHQTAVATSSGRSTSMKRLTPGAQVHMPSGTSSRTTKTVTVFASRCLWADALTKVALMAPAAQAAKTLAHHRARAVIFQSNGRIDKVLVG
jgi:thiamine biosynthesis lipoprotein